MRVADRAAYPIEKDGEWAVVWFLKDQPQHGDVIRQFGPGYESKCESWAFMHMMNNSLGLNLEQAWDVVCSSVAARAALL